MEYQKNSRRSHDSIIEAVGVWVGFAPELLYSSALEPGLVLLPAQLGELFQALAVLGLGALAELPHGFCSVGGGRD